MCDPVLERLLANAFPLLKDNFPPVRRSPERHASAFPTPPFPRKRDA